MKKHFLQRFVITILLSALLAAAAASGVLARPNNVLADVLYQRPQALDGNIVLLEIDERALEALGPFQTWKRDVFARAIEALNAEPSARPAVIGVDVIFTGETEPAADAGLARAAGEYGNVVTAASAQFGSALVTQPDGSFYMEARAITGYDEPYAALAASAAEAHVNAMYDSDGVLRHAIWQIKLPDGRTIPSFHQQIYREYAAFNGQAAYTPPLDAAGRWYVPYRARPGGYSDSYSLIDLLSGALPSDVFADKIVLIGPYAAGLQDSYTTAIDHAVPMYGMEYQANAIDALIACDGKRAVPVGLQAALLFILCVLYSLWLWERRVLPAMAVWLAICCVSVAASLLAFARGWLLQPLYVPLMATVLFIVSVAVNYMRAAVARRRVTMVFRRYVAPEIVEELLREDADTLGLGGKLTDIAVLFVDIRGFTALSETLPPTEVVEILNRYLTLTTACIFQNSGTLDKFVGDCTMAFWGAPLPQEDAAYQAVRAALQMVNGSVALNEELEARFGRTVSFGIGVHCGPAVVGNIGAPERMDFTAIGDTVNTAARLEEAAPGGTVLVSHAVAAVLGERAICAPLAAPLKMKGKAEAFAAFTLESLR